MTREIYEGLPQTDEERDTYVARLRALKIDEEQRIVFDHLYANLDSLDGKSNSMIQFVAVLAAIYSVLVGFRINEIYTYQSIHGGVRVGMLDMTLLLGAICVIVAGIFFLIVLKVHWSAVDELIDPTKQAHRLLRVRDARSVRYRWGRLFTFAAYVLLGVSLLVALLDVFLEGPRYIRFLT